MFARGVTQNTARSGCKEMPGSFPLPMWYYLREPATPSTTSLLSEQWQPLTQRLPDCGSDRNFFSKAPISLSSPLLTPSTPSRLFGQMKTSVGATRRLQGVALVLISTQTFLARTWRTCCLPRLMSRAGKCPGQKASQA